MGFISEFWLANGWWRTSPSTFGGQALDRHPYKIIQAPSNQNFMKTILNEAKGLKFMHYYSNFGKILQEILLVKVAIKIYKALTSS